MELKEFIEAQKSLLDDFVADYERRRKRKQLTMIRPVQQWKELYEDFKHIYDRETGAENQEHDVENRKDYPSSQVRTSDREPESDRRHRGRRRAA